MVTLNILKLLSENGFGTIAITGDEPNANLFHEKLPLGKEGLYIMSRGAPLSRGSRTLQVFDIYAKGSNDFDGAEKLEQVLEFLDDAYGNVCTLPQVPPISTTEYKNVALQPISNVENAGLDANNRVIYVCSGQVTYKK